SACHSSQSVTALNGFLATLEKDAKERAQRRRRNDQLANALKEQGNEAFRAGDFALAIQRYSEGLNKLRDKQELYTNRAQVKCWKNTGMLKFSKLIMISFLTQCNKNYLKAYFLMGKAHLALISLPLLVSLSFFLVIFPCALTDCVSQARLEEKRVRDEERAEREVQAGNVTALSIQELLQTISSPGQDILYYTGAIRILAELVNDCEYLLQKLLIWEV
uniref:Uncharacterized protein n=1 Tax=Zosterops lateralis melanops TaxID=1220523 RepID=A0A8D2PTD8_ZOSLA